MGNALLAERLGCTPQEAGKILDDFYVGFPKVKQWKEEVESFAKKNGYVEDVWGRRRRLPDLFLPKYEFISKDTQKSTFNPILHTEGINHLQKPPLIAKYEQLLNNAKGFKEVEKLKQEAAKQGVRVIDHGSHISTAERQCVNAVIQGSAATMTKKAMIKAYHDKELTELGFHMLIPVHDELIGECPKENVDRVCERLAEVMISAPGDDVDVPFKCDGVMMDRWYSDEYKNEFVEELEKRASKDGNKQKVFNEMLLEKPEAYVIDFSDVDGISY